MLICLLTIYENLCYFQQEIQLEIERLTNLLEI